MLIVLLLNHCREIVKLIVTYRISSLANHSYGLQNTLHMAGFVSDAPAGFNNRIEKFATAQSPLPRRDSLDNISTSSCELHLSIS